MKKVVSSFIVLLLSASFAFTQTFNATLAIDDVDVTALNPGDDVIIPVRLEYMDTGGLIIGFQFLIEFDHTILLWKGQLMGVTNFNPVFLPLSPYDWLFNDNGIALTALWFDPTYTNEPVNIPNGEQFFDLIFTYIGGLGVPDSSLLTFQDQTEMYSQFFEPFVLSYNNGSIYTTIQTSIHELEANTIRIWSNKQNILINFPGSTNGNIVVFNMMGQEVISTDIEAGLNVIPVNKVNTYFIVKVSTSNNVVTEKVYIK